MHLAPVQRNENMGVFLFAFLWETAVSGFLRSGTLPRIPRVGRLKSSSDSASQGSDLDENRCTRRFSMWRSGPGLLRPSGGAGSARHRYIRLSHIEQRRLHQFSSKPDFSEAKPGQMFG